MLPQPDNPINPVYLLRLCRTWIPLFGSGAFQALLLWSCLVRISVDCVRPINTGSILLTIDQSVSQQVECVCVLVIWNSPNYSFCFDASWCFTKRLSTFFWSIAVGLVCCFSNGLLFSYVRHFQSNRNFFFMFLSPGFERESILWFDDSGSFWVVVFLNEGLCASTYVGEVYCHVPLCHLEQDTFNHKPALGEWCVCVCYGLHIGRHKKRCHPTLQTRLPTFLRPLTLPNNTGTLVKSHTFIKYQRNAKL